LLAEQYDQLHRIKALADTEGGKELQNLIMADVVARVNALESQYKTASHAEIIALCADLSSHLQLARLLTSAEENLKYVDEAIANALA
jgi:hypothetical protein